MQNRCCGHLQIRIRQDSTAIRQACLDFPEDSSRCQDECIDVPKVPLAIGRSEGAFVKLSNRDGARKLFASRNPREPAEVSWIGPRTEDLGDGVGVEEISQRPSR